MYNMEQTTKKQPYLIFIAIIIAGLLVSGAILWKDGSGSGENEDNSAASSNIKSSGASKNGKPKRTKEYVKIEGEGDDPVLGSPNAPVSMVIFGDFQCHFCRKLELEIKPLIVEKYVKTGKVKIIARDFPFLGKNSALAAEAGNCALEQGNYWEFSDYLHRAQDTEEIISVNSDALKETARKLKLDGNNFDKCLNSEKYLNEVKKDFEDGKLLGIEGTPTTFINNERIDGAEPYSEFEKVIDAL